MPETVTRWIDLLDPDEEALRRGWPGRLHSRAVKTLLEAARELIVDARDYHHAKVANDQNEVTKRLTVIASIVLPPTFIVGIYGQNFVHMPELVWAQGYGFSWALIVLITLAQLYYFRRKRWI